MESLFLIDFNISYNQVVKNVTSLINEKLRDTCLTKNEIFFFCEKKSLKHYDISFSTEKIKTLLFCY